MTDPICKGSFQLGTACGKCERCNWTKASAGYFGLEPAEVERRLAELARRLGDADTATWPSRGLRNVLDGGPEPQPSGVVTGDPSPALDKFDLDLIERLDAQNWRGVDSTLFRLTQSQASRLRVAIAAQPIPMILFCPACGEQHIDAPDDKTPGWTNPPHRSHLCHGCGHIWRPADVPTEGVASLQTEGRNDGPPTNPRIHPNRQELVDLIDSNEAYAANVMDENRIWLAGILADQIIAARTK